MASLLLRCLPWRLLAAGRQKVDAVVPLAAGVASLACPGPWARSTAALQLLSHNRSPGFRSWASHVRWIHTIITAGAPEVTVDMIPRAKLDTSFSRSGGAGGQNVNKLNTKAEVRFHVPSADWLDDHTKQRLMLMSAGQVTKDGDLIIVSQRHRT
jgi:hypothetical protein